MLKQLLFGLLTALSLYGGTHIVVLGDPHLAGKHPQMKEEVLEHINQWKDVDMVVAMGDLCSKTGTVEEYTYVKTYFSKLKKPLFQFQDSLFFLLKYQVLLEQNPFVPL